MIQAASSMEQRENYLPAITKMLGLRGHLYGELVRIQMMLAEDDPQMKVFYFYLFIYHLRKPAEQ